MKVFIRTDSSLDIGTGHLMRCLTLAGELSGRGAKVSFICRDLAGNMNQQVLSAGFRLYRLPFSAADTVNIQALSEHERWLAVDKKFDADQTRSVLAEAGTDCDLLIVDHYALDRKWESVIRSCVSRLMVIDDLADRPHDCDILLDQNLYENMPERYRHLVSANTRLLLGPSFVLLRKEFHRWREKVTARTGPVRKVLVSYGGADRTNETMKFLRTLETAQKDNLEYMVVVGKTNPHGEDVKTICATRPKLRFYRAVDDMARLMAETDLAVGAGGTSTWERCCMGLPAITVAVADNQIEVARLSEKTGFAVYLGTASETGADKTLEAVINLASNQEKINKMSTIGMGLVDGRGAARVCDVISETVEAGKHI